MLNSKCVVVKPGPFGTNGVVPLETSLGGSWGLSKWVHNGDNWGYYMAYRSYEPTYCKWVNN